MTAGSSEARRIAKWDGMTWSPVGDGVSSQIFGMVAYDGDLYVGGNLNTAGGVISNKFARWDGVNWSSPFGSFAGNSLSSVAESFVTYNDELVMGGWFKIAGMNVVNCIASWDGSMWSGIGGGLGDDFSTGRVDAVQVFGASPACRIFSRALPQPHHGRIDCGQARHPLSGRAKSLLPRTRRTVPGRSRIGRIS